MDTLRKTPPWMLPVAIVVAGSIVACALYFVRINKLVHEEAGDVRVVRPVSPMDHLMGNPTAPVIVVQYGDIDSEFSKKFNAIMTQIMAEYAESGKVAWVYRHLPIIATHPYSATHASAAECVASLSGPESFWRFLDALAAQAPGTNQFDPKYYDTVISGLGVPAAPFAECLAKGTFEKRVQDDYANALLAGATGAPYLVLVVKGQPPVSIDGALPYTSMKKVLEESLKKAGA